MVEWHVKPSMVGLARAKCGAACGTVTAKLGRPDCVHSSPPPVNDESASY